MQISDNGLRFIERFENVYKPRYCPYWDPYGRVWSRGFGETDWNGNFGGRCISYAEATENLRSLVNKEYGAAVNGLGVKLNQNQFDALCSFVYNLGPGSLGWDVGQSLRKGDYTLAAYQMLKYDTAGGVVLAGLEERRREERNLFLTGPQHMHNPLDVLYPNERKAVDRHIKYRKHPKLHRRALKKLKNEMTLMRKNIFDAAVYGRLKDGQKVSRGWNISHRKARYEILKKYTS